MVLKTLFASTIEEEEEEDVYLRKCNIRKSRRQNEKSRKIALQTNEAMNLERVPSPVPLPTIRSGSIGKSPARKEKPYSSPYFPHQQHPKSRSNSTDDVYPAPSPPPRSPSFGSPVALGRTLALSLSLFSPGGFTISGSGRKSQSHNALSSMRSPEYVGIQRAHSNESNGEWGEIVELHSPHSPHRSPQRSPYIDSHKTLDPTSTTSTTFDPNTTTNANKTPTRSEEYYHDGEHNAHLRDSNRVKQFLFHRDRNRARKAQLLYPSGTYGNSCEFSPDLDEKYHNSHNSHNYPDAKNRSDRKIGSPGGKNRRSGSFGAGGSGNVSTGSSGKHSRKYSDERNIKIDVDTDTRSGSIGSVSGVNGVGGGSNSSMLTPSGVRRPSFRVDSPTTPYAIAVIEGSAEHNSPYYRALTLGARNSPVNSMHGMHSSYTSTNTITSPSHANSSIPIHKDVRGNSISSVGSSNDSVLSVSPVSSTTINAIAYDDTYVRRRRDSIASPDSPSSNDRSVEIYETLFPALPVGLTKTASNVSSVVDSVYVLDTSVHVVDNSVDGVKYVAPVLVAPVPVVPLVPVYTTEQVCSMFHTAIVHAGLMANNMSIDTATTNPTPTTASTTTPNTTTTTTTTTAPRYRAWDDADSSDDESTSDQSCVSDSTANSTNTSVHAIQHQVQKLSEIDATCCSLIQKCDYIYDTIKTRVPYKFDSEYVRSIVVPFVTHNTSHATTAITSTSTSTSTTATLSISELFTHYVQSRLVYQLVQLLQYEDTRFESNRLPVLLVLYKGSIISSTNTTNTTSTTSTTTNNTNTAATTSSNVSVRVKIAQAIEHTTSERVLRCKQLLHSATLTEMDVNFISKSGYSELVTSNTTSSGTNTTNATTSNTTLHPLVAVGTACDLSAIIESENERSSYKTKDSEVTIIELVKFIIAHEIGELLLLQGGGGDDSSSDSNSNSNSNSKGGSSVSAAQRTAESRRVLMCIVRAYCSLFRCYTYKLGAHYAGSGDSVEQPVLLEYLMQTLDGILAWAKVLCNCIVDSSIVSGGVYGSHSNSNSPNKSGGKKKLRRQSSDPTTPITPTHTTTSNSSTSTTDSASTISVLEEVCECILHSAHKHWTNRLNYAQDIAYLLQCEVILTIYAPTSASSSVNNNSSSSGLSYSAVFASTNRTDTAAKAVLPPLFTQPTTSITTSNTTCVVQRILYKMLTRVSSQHVKVATQAMQSIQCPILMVRYFLPRMTTAMVTYIFGTEVGRITFMSGPGWENGRREECLNLLVDKLRDCRNVYLNFSTQLQISSTQLLDTTLELLQVIEDAE